MLQPCSRFFWVSKTSGFPVLFIQQIFLGGYLFAKQSTSFHNHNPTVIGPAYITVLIFSSLFQFHHFYQWWSLPLVSFYFCILQFLLYSSICLFLELVLIYLLKSLQIPTPVGLQMLYMLFPKAKLMMIISSPTDLKIATLHMVFLSRGTKSCTFLTILCTLWTVSKS